MASLSRELARWVSALRYEDLPPAVVDRAKGVTLHCLASVLVGSQTPPGRQAVKLVVDEESGVKRGATIMVDGTKVTKGGAAFANSEMGFAGGKWDTFRMLTHPGTSIVPSALVAAEIAGASGKDFIAGVVAGYEVSERMSADFIATLMARGFHPGPVFGLFGAAIAAAKIMGLDAEQLNSTIALCASLAGGNPEAARSGGKALREGAAVRNAMLAVALAQQGHVGGETVLEGPAGFYHAYAGNNRGQLTYSFVGDTQTSLDKITAHLGQEWLFLETIDHRDLPAILGRVETRLQRPRQLRPVQRRPGRAARAAQPVTSEASPVVDHGLNTAALVDPVGMRARRVVLHAIDGGPTASIGQDGRVVETIRSDGDAGNDLHA